MTRSTTAPTSLLRWLPAVAWMAAIFGFSSVHGSTIPSVLSAYAPVAHFAEYGVLALLLVFAAAGWRLSISLALALLLACSLYGVTDEFHQRFVPGRTPDPVDWATDTAGAGVAIGAIALLRARRG